MDGGIKQPLPPALRGLPIARVFLNVGNEAGVEDRFAFAPGIESAIEIETRTLYRQIRQSGHAVEGIESIRKAPGIGFIHRCRRKRGQHKAIVLDDPGALLALLMLVAGIADAIAAL